MPHTKLFVFFGLIASGKSTLAEAWAKKIRAPYWNSDIVRKELAGMQPQMGVKSSFNQGIYSADFSKKTYDELLKRAANNLRREESVVLDASYQERQERRRVCGLAESFAQKATFVLCRCPEPIMKERMEIRAQDPNAVSDGRWEIYLQQREKFQQPIELEASQLINIDTDKPVNLLVEQLEIQCCRR